MMPRKLIKPDQRAVLLFRTDDGYEAIGLDGRVIADSSALALRIRVRQRYPGVRIHDCRHTGWTERKVTA